MTIPSGEIYDASYNTVATKKTYLGTDVHANAEQVHSDVYDLDAADFNRLVAGLSEVAFQTHWGNLAILTFFDSNAIASQTDTDLSHISDTAIKQAISPFAGSVVGIGIQVENSVTAPVGVDPALTVYWTKNGTQQTLNVTLDDTTNPDNNYESQAVGSEVIAAGDTVGCSYDSHASFAAGATPTIKVELFISVGRA